MRNLCFAVAYSEKNYEIKTENYLFYYDSPKCNIARKVKNNSVLGVWNKKIKPGYYFKSISYNNAIKKIINFLKDFDEEEMNIWIELKQWMIRKESNL